MRIQAQLVLRAAAVLAAAGALALVPVATPAQASAGAAVHDRIFVVVETGAKNTPAIDTNGIAVAVFLVQPSKDRICYAIAQANLTSDVTLAHIHKAPVGSNGPVVVPLTAPVRGSSRGCVAVADALVTDIAANPQSYYTNVHTVMFPAGEVRSQLR